MEQGREWVAKNERTVYKPLATQEQQIAPEEADATPLIVVEHTYGADALFTRRDAVLLLRGWAVEGAEEGERAGLLDLRDETEYDAGHIVGATR